MKQKLVKVEKEKKEGKVKLQNEIERLQTKLQEVNQEKEGLKEAIKFQEREKLEAKAVSKAVEKKIEPVRQINYWEGAPTRSYIYKFAEPTFTLLDLDMSFFSYEQLEHYQYYLSKQTGE